jgi:hypothetical protein
VVNVGVELLVHIRHGEQGYRARGDASFTDELGRRAALAQQLSRPDR